MVESSQNKNITLYTYSEIEEVGGYIGNFEVKIRIKARSVDMAKCTGCGTCCQKCPVKVDSEFNLSMGKRRAIYVPFPQAVPNKPVIDREHCLYYKTGKCKLCVKACPADAIFFDQKDEFVTVKVGAIVMATGFDLFNTDIYGEYGGGKNKDIISGLQLERLISPSGPTGGHILRPSDQKEPKNVVFIQCVGSRDEEKGMVYCSNVCCMYTAKQAILLKEHIPDVEITVFYIDIRSGGKNYEQFVNQAIERYGVVYLRGRVAKVFERGGKLIVRGADTLSGTQLEVDADLVVLASAIVPQKNAKDLAKKVGIPYDEFGFYNELHPKLAPVETVSAGIYLAGVCRSPRDIPDSVASASGAAAKVTSLFSNEMLSIEPLVSSIDTTTCIQCKMCQEVCPYNAIIQEEITLRDGSKKKQMRVLESLCQGCGNCVSTCRSSSVMLKGITDEQIFAELEAFSF
jgi:heterodisulfide reductase subunit A